MKNGKTPFWAQRKARRGSLLFDALLYLGVAAGAVGLTSAIIFDQSRRQDNNYMAATLKQNTISAQAYVSENYDLVRENLLAAAVAGTGDALLRVTMQDLVDAGYIPASFVIGGEITNRFQQEHSLLIRGVNRNDPTLTTLTAAEIDADGDGVIDPQLIDDIPTNGEFEIEAILVTHGGEAIPGQRGAPIAVATELPGVGFISVDDVASGAYGSFRFDLTPFQDFDAAWYPTVGHFASIVALSNFGVLGADNDDADRDVLRRCIDLDPILDAVEYGNCMGESGNELYSNIVFNSYIDDDGSTAYPTLSGLTRISCGDPDPLVPPVAGEFIIDCATTRISGDLDVGDDISIAGTPVIENEARGDGVSEVRVTANRITVDGPDGPQDISSFLSLTSVVAPRATVAKPTCPIAADGTPMVPEIQVTPVAHVDAGGRSLAGVQALFEDVDATEWRVRMVSFLEEDFCDFSLAGPRDPAGAFYSGADFDNGAPNQAGCSVFTMVDATDTAGNIIYESDGTTPKTRWQAPASGSPNDYSDGLVDVYEVGQDHGWIRAETKCVMP